MSPTSYQTAPPRVIYNCILNYYQTTVNMKRGRGSKHRKSQGRRPLCSFFSCRALANHTKAFMDKSSRRLKIWSKNPAER